MPAMNDSCTPVETVTWDQLTVTLGDTISYDKTEWSKKNEKRTARHESTVIELWHEDWWGCDGGLYYAELENGERAWFHRDHIGSIGELGVEPTGALF